MTAAEIAAGLTKARREALAGAHRISDFNAIRHVHCSTSISDRQALMDAGLLLGWQLTPLGLEIRAILAKENTDAR